MSHEWKDTFVALFAFSWARQKLLLECTPLVLGRLLGSEAAELDEEVDVDLWWA